MVGRLWLLGDTGYLNSLDIGIFVPLYLGGLLVFLLLDGLLAIASGWRGATAKSLFLPLIMNGVVELLLGAWVVLQMLGYVRVPIDTAPWPPAAFWMDVGIGFLFAGALLLAGASGLNARYGRAWLLASGVAFVVSGVFMMLTSSSSDFAWMGDVATSSVGALLFVLALQLQVRHQERAVGA